MTLKPILIIVALFFLLSIACTGPATPPPQVPEASRVQPENVEPVSDINDPVHSAASGDVEAGASLYQTNCVSCHSLEAGTTQVGPSIVGLASRSAETITLVDYTGDATSVEGYILESIMNPSVYYLPDFPKNIMPNYEDTLTAQEINDLLAYLMTSLPPDDIIIF